MNWRVPAILLLALLPGVQTIGFEFTFDDQVRLLDNLQIRDLSLLGQAFTQPTWPGNLYRPLENLTYALTYSAFSYLPWVYHITNLLLHVAVCLVLFLLLRKLFGSDKAFAAAALFAVHPLHAEVIANVSYRTESLAVLFTLLALLLSLELVSTADQRARLRLAPALSLALFCSLISKESGAHALLLGPLVIWFAQAKITRNAALILAVAVAVPVAAYACLRWNALNGIIVAGAAIKAHDNPLVKLSAPMRIFDALILLGRYLLLSFVPFHVSAVSTFPKMVPARELSQVSAFELVELGFLAGLVVFAWRTRKTSRAVLFWTGWFFASMAVTSNIFVATGTIFADRLCYLASAAACGLLAEAAWSAVDLRLRRFGGMALGSVFCAMLWINISYWSDNYTLFAYEARQSTRSSLANRMFGKELLYRGEIDQAILHLKLAEELYPYCLRSPKLLALAYLEKGDFAAARVEAQKTLRHLPEDKLSRAALRCASDGLEHGRLNEACSGLRSSFQGELEFAGAVEDSL